MITLTKRQMQDLLSGLLPVALNHLKDVLGVHEVRMMPKPGSPFFLYDRNGAPADLTLPMDSGIGVPTLLSQSWDLLSRPNYNRIADRIDAPNLTLVDVGANVGLFSRQMKVRLGDKLSGIVCYEPHPDNYRLLRLNLSAIDGVECMNSAIGETAGTMALHIDSKNAGNYSLTSHAIRADQSDASIEVDVLAAADEFSRIVREYEGPFIYKSDVQGYDAKIASLIPVEFWRRTRMASFELWRLPGNDYDEDAFARILDQFDHVMFESSFGREASSREVIAYLRGSDMKDDDLYAWRD